MVSCPPASTLLTGMATTLSSLPVRVKNIFATRTWLENVRFFLTSSCLLYWLQCGFNEDNTSFTPRSWSFASFLLSFWTGILLKSQQLWGANFNYVGERVLIKHAFAITWRTSAQWTEFVTFWLLLRNASVCDPMGLKYEPSVFRGVKAHFYLLYFPIFLASRTVYSSLSVLNTQDGFSPHRNWCGSDGIVAIHTRHFTFQYLSPLKKIYLCLKK